MNPGKTTKILKTLLYSLLVLDAALLVGVCWLSFAPPVAAHAQTASQYPELDKNGKPITPDSVLALMPATTALVDPPAAQPASASS